MSENIDRYRLRRQKRLMQRMDAEDDGKWVTTKEGHKIHISDEGVPDKGNPHVLAATNTKHVNAVMAAVAKWKTGSTKYADCSAKVKKALSGLADGTEVKLGNRIYTKTTGATGKIEFRKADSSESLDIAMMPGLVYTAAHTRLEEIEIGFDLAKGDKKKITSGEKASPDSGKTSTSTATSSKPATSTGSTNKTSTSSTAKASTSSKAKTSSSSATKEAKKTPSSPHKVETSVGKFSEKELKILDKLSEEMGIGGKFVDQPDDDQGLIYTEACERWLL